MRHTGRTACLVVFGLTLAQLALPAVAPTLPQFSGKAFGTRLIAYPAMTWLAPLLWWLAARRRPVHAAHTGSDRRAGRAPWWAFALIMAPFLIDVTGNTLDLYDTIAWWDDANHFVNWALLLGGIGLLIDPGPRSPRWLFATAVTGLGAILAIAWELGEWATFIRFGTELDTAYVDTLGDLSLGTMGAALAGLLIAWPHRRAQGHGSRREA